MKRTRFSKKFHTSIVQNFVGASVLFEHHQATNHEIRLKILDIRNDWDGCVMWSFYRPCQVCAENDFLERSELVVWKDIKTCCPFLDDSIVACAVLLHI